MAPVFVRGGTTTLRRLPTAFLAMVAVLFGCGDSSSGPEEVVPDLRAEALAAGLAAMPTAPIYPAENPYVAERVDLGHRLYFDPILSGPLDVACSTCHLPRMAFTDGRQFPTGAGATGLGPDRTIPAPPLREMPRNSPPTLNLGLFGRNNSTPTTNGTMFWSGSAFGLEDQVLAPIAMETELRGEVYPKNAAIDSVLLRLRDIPEYMTLFEAAFPTEAAAAAGDPGALIIPTTLRLALAAYIRELITPNAPLDRYLAGDDGALTNQQKDGLGLFIGDAGCVQCHTGPLLSDFTMHVIGGGQEGLGRDTTPGDDLGWGEHGGTPYSFRTSPLRQITETPPYLHAGTEATLRDVLEFKNAGVSEHPSVTPSMMSDLVEPLGLTLAELDALEAFMEALTDPLIGAGPLFDAPASVPSGLTIPQ